MRRSMLSLFLALAGCGTFDEYYQHDAFVYEATVEPPCGCSGRPRTAPPPFAPGPPPTLTGSASSPLQSREPELLR